MFINRIRLGQQLFYYIFHSFLIHISSLHSLFHPEIISNQHIWYSVLTLPHNKVKIRGGLFGRQIVSIYKISHSLAVLVNLAKNESKFPYFREIWVPGHIYKLILTKLILSIDISMFSMVPIQCPHSLLDKLLEHPRHEIHKHVKHQLRHHLLVY